MLVHLGPEADLVEGAVEAYLGLGALDEHQVAVTGSADALVANGLARDLHGGGAAGVRDSGL